MPLQKDASIIYVTPDVQHFKLLEYGKMDEIVRLGFEAANKKLEVSEPQGGIELLRLTAPLATGCPSAP